MVPGRPVVLSATELDVVWRALGIGEPPVVLDVPSPGHTHAERRRLEHAVWCGLVERQLATGPGAPAARVERRLRTIARAQVVVEARGWLDGEVRAILGRLGQSAALIVIRGPVAQLHVVPATGLARTIMRLWPPLPAGAGHSVTVAVDDFVAAAQESRGTVLRAALVARGMRGMDARALVEMAGRCDGYVQFDAVVQDRAGTAHRAAGVRTARAASGAGYLLTRRVTPAGHSASGHLTLAPAGPGKIESSVAEMVDDLVRTHRG